MSPGGPRERGLFFFRPEHAQNRCVSGTPLFEKETQMPSPNARPGKRRKRRALRGFRNYKQRGEWVEFKFMAEAAARGFRVARPLGESARYDAVVEGDAGFQCVQVKSTDAVRDSGYCCGIANSGRAPNGTRRTYSADEVDFLAAYVIPEDAWYIIPATAVGKRLWLLLYPHRATPNRHLFEQYRDGWHLLHQPVGRKRRGRTSPPAKTGRKGGAPR